MNYKKLVVEKIKSLKEVSNVVPFNLNKENLVIFDFTKANDELTNIDISNTEEFNKYIFNKLKENNSPAGIGNYAENRTIYSRSSVFDGVAEPRTIHLGIDIWAEAGTEVYAPIDGRVHSFNNNSSFGDYGPTIILEHKIDDIIFYTLYGHLSLESLDGLKKNKKFKAGEKIAELGTPEVNVQWPPHLHFQIITDMLGKEGDFPGVSSSSEINFYLEICPDPNLLLRIDKLNKF